MRIIKTYDTDTLDPLKISVIRLSRQEPVLWFYNGMFCVIPIEIIKNAYEQSDMNTKLPSKSRHPIVEITWDQGIPVDPKVGYALMGIE